MSSVNNDSAGRTQDERLMRRALELAERGVGWCSPNPPVGAVLVRDGEIVGEGWHQRAGGPHAEVVALRDAASGGTIAVDGVKAASGKSRVGGLGGSRLYVTLEPCNHHGRTPPCTHAIVEAGVAEVVVATHDPNPRVAGGGVEFLRNKGVTVRTGVCAGEAEHLIRMFAGHVTSGRPFVVAKFGASLDGKTATGTGASQWITGTASRQKVHELRHAVDAIVVGVDTVVADNPALTARRDVPSRDPRPVVLDTTGRIPVSSQLLANAPENGLVIAATGAIPGSIDEKLVAAGAEVWRLPTDDRGRVELHALLERLGSVGIQSVLVEGGSRVHGSFFDADLVDEVWAFVAPSIIGGNSAPSAVAGLGASTLSYASRFQRRLVDVVGEDILVQLARKTNEETRRICSQE